MPANVGYGVRNCVEPMCNYKSAFRLISVKLLFSITKSGICLLVPDLLPQKHLVRKVLPMYSSNSSVMLKCRNVVENPLLTHIKLLHSQVSL